MNFIIRWIVTAISVAAAVWLVPGIEILSNSASWVGIVFFALILSLINMSIKPILQILSLPVTVLTLGIFYLVVNTLLLYIAAWLANGLFGAGFYIASFGTSGTPSSSRWCPPSSTASSATTRNLSCSPQRLRQPVAREGILPGTPACSDIFRPRATGLFLRQAYQKTLTRRFSEKEKVK